MIFVVLFMIAMTLIMSMMDKKVQGLDPKKEAVCPPHKWSYVEQPGMPETFYIKCGLCKKTPTQVGNGL